MVGYGLFTGGLGFHYGAVELGAAVVPSSGGMTPRQVILIRDLRPDILACTPSYAIRLGEALAEAGVGPGPGEGLALKAGLFGAEPWSEQMRAGVGELLPLLRYRTGDIASLRHGTCVCGRTLVKMSKVTDRRDDMLVVRGVNVYPGEVERVLLAEPGICPDYLLVLDERQAASRLIACCEYLTTGTAGSPARAPATAGPPE